MIKKKLNWQMPQMQMFWQVDLSSPNCLLVITARTTVDTYSPPTPGCFYFYFIFSFSLSLPLFLFLLIPLSLQLESPFATLTTK